MGDRSLFRARRAEFLRRTAITLVALASALALSDCGGSSGTDSGTDSGTIDDSASDAPSDLSTNDVTPPTDAGDGGGLCIMPGTLGDCGDAGTDSGVCCSGSFCDYRGNPYGSCTACFPEFQACDSTTPTACCAGLQCLMGMRITQCLRP
jgi:hypothetical protein